MLHSAQRRSRNHAETDHRIEDAPAAIGPYSQAVRVGDIVYMSGQIGLDRRPGILVEGIEAQAHQVFLNMRAVAEAAGGSLDDIVMLHCCSSDMGDFVKVNEIMTSYFKPPFSGAGDCRGSGFTARGKVEVVGTLAIPATP